MGDTSKYTPEPWYIASTGNHQGLIISEATGANVAVAYNKIDAPLIAAAPNLLDLLCELTTDYELKLDGNLWAKRDRELLGRVNAIITKFI